MCLRGLSSRLQGHHPSPGPCAWGRAPVDRRRTLANWDRPSPAKKVAAMTPTTPTSAPAITDDEIAAIDAWWRANNYLTIGQIYLQDNPLLREPLTPDHIKPRLLGHWGTSPGLSFIYAHVSRLIQHTGQECDLPDRPRARRPGAGGGRLPGGHLHRDLPATSPRTRPASSGCSGSSPRPGGIPSHVSVTTPGSIHEGGELGLRPGARLRRGDGQPGPAGHRRGRRRRGRDRPAGGVVEGHLVPQPGPRRRGAADPAPQRRQDRRPDRARPQGPGARCARCSRATATRCSRSRATTCPACTTGSPRRSLQAYATIREIQTRRPTRRCSGRAPPQLADDRPAHAQGLDRAAGDRRHPGDRHAGARTRSRCPGSRTIPEHLALLERVAAVVPAGGAVRRQRRAGRAGAGQQTRRATCG